MTYGTYSAGQALAGRVRARFARDLDAGRRASLVNLAPLPPVEAIEAIIDAAFWASLRREEVYVPKISLAFLPHEATSRPLVFERPLPLEPAALARVAPAVERPGIHLGAWQDGDGFWVWGTTRVLPTHCLVLEVAAPGLLVVKQHRGGEQAKYGNVAVLEGDQIKFVDEKASSLPDCPSLLTSLLGFDSPASWADSVNVLVQLAVSMRAHGRGGLLLVVPAGNDAGAIRSCSRSRTPSIAAVLRARGADAQRPRRNGKSRMAGRSGPRRRCRRRADGRRRRDDDDRQLRPPRVRRQDCPPQAARRRSSR